jgi:hypothetical protein
MHPLANFIAFQIGWFACAFGAANHRPWIGTSIALTLVALHLRVARAPRRELALILVAALIGATFDSALAAGGLLRFTSGAPLPGLTAHWMVALWMLFATTIDSSMRWLRGRPFLAAALAAVAGPLAYSAGERLGALSLGDSTATLSALVAGWAVATPTLCTLAARYDAAEDGGVLRLGPLASVLRCYASRVRHCRAPACLPPLHRAYQRVLSRTTP